MHEWDDQDNPATQSGHMLTLIAICGELPADQIPRLPGGDAYKQNVLKQLRKDGLIKTFAKDGLRGYRLLEAAKEKMLRENANRFSFYLTGASETNHIRSEIPRRLRLHRLAETTVTMLNAQVEIFRDRKTPVFVPQDTLDWTRTDVRLPAFYSSRECKELGLDAVKMGGARAMGVLLCEDRILTVYNPGDSLVRWEYMAEMRFQAMMKNILCRERLAHLYPTEPMEGLLLANTMELVGEILHPARKGSYFLLDGGYAHFHYLTNDRHGERLLMLLCSPALQSALDEILSDDLCPRNRTLAIENDAVDDAGNPVLFAYTCDLVRLKKFDSAIRMREGGGTVICFDFQKDALAGVMSGKIHFQTISFAKWERSFFGDT